jgi:hypothetical protein
MVYPTEEAKLLGCLTDANTPFLAVLTMDAFAAGAVDSINVKGEGLDW